MLRRERLAIAANPDSRHDYLILLTGQPWPQARPPGRPDTTLELRYVPDRWIIDADAFATYLAEGFAGAPTGLEALALAVLDDVLNEVVPRWAEVRVETATPHPHLIAVEDRQPDWDNPRLLARLGTL